MDSQRSKKNGLGNVSKAFLERATLKGPSIRPAISASNRPNIANRSAVTNLERSAVSKIVQPMQRGTTLYMTIQKDDPHTDCYIECAKQILQNPTTEIKNTLKDPYE